MFSEREEKIIKVIGEKKFTLEEISERVFKGITKPFDDKITIANSIRRINKKCEFNKLNWTFERLRQDKKTVIYKRRG